MDGMNVGLLMLAAGLAIVILLLAMVADRARRRFQEQENNIGSTTRDLRIICNAVIHLGERLGTLEQWHRQLQQQQQELGVRQNQMAHLEPEEHNFEQATKLARRGSSSDEIMEICGLSKGEAELILMVQKPDKKE